MILYYFLSILSLYLLSFIIGLCVTYKNLRVNYARKIVSILFFLLTTLILIEFDKASGWTGIILGITMPLLWIFSFLKPIRERIKFFAICFASIDRPEDRPHTILWLSTAVIIGYWVLILMIEWLKIYNAEHLVFITLFISTFGDGLAEPIGVKFGKNKYKTRALFTKQFYHRTFEGSACVTLSAIAIIVAMANHMTEPQFWAMLLIMPIAMTLTEAKSPHTWDNPFMHLAGGLITVGIIHFL
jgi:phytol kinase